MAASAQTRPEPMNSTPHHSKVKVSLTLAHPIFVAGKFVSGKMEMECRADKGLGISVMMVELFASQELTSRDHSATSTFLHSRRLFQGPGLPPSNAVQAHPLPGDPPLPAHYHQARRGISTFLFRVPLPTSAPSTISFGGDLARVRYEVRATVGVVWKGEKRLVTCNRMIDVVESCEEEFARIDPEGVIVGELGKIWVQGKVVGGLVVAGESACVELQVKNHSNKKNTGLTLALTRTLVLPGAKAGEPSPLQISDVLTTVPFRGPDYIIHPGGEGIASLVFDVPKHARGVRGGPLEGDESEARTTESLFEIRCVVGITINMGIGTKDIHLELPVPVVHPAALPEPAEYPQVPYGTPAPYPAPAQAPAPYHPQAPYVYPALPVSPLPAAYIDPVQNQVWLPPPQAHTPQPQYFSPPIDGMEPQYYFPPPPQIPIPTYLPARPLSAGPAPNDPLPHHVTSIGVGLPPVSQHLLVPHGNVEPEEGKGERASRVTQHLRLSSRTRSVSPMSHRFPARPPLPAPPTQQPTEVRLRNLPPAPLSIPLPPPQVDGGLAVASEQVVHSPRPFLSPKRSFTNSLPKSERVEQLERMAEDVERTAIDLSGDLPKMDSTPAPIATPKAPVESNVNKPIAPPVAIPDAPAESNINKTLPVPPPPSRKAKESAASRARIDDYFGDALVPPPTSEQPKTPLAAVTPIKVPSKPQSTEFRLGGGRQGESGLDALEKRLLAEVGTRKMDLGNERRPAWAVVGAQPIDIPAKQVTPDPLNDSAISSLTLAGDREPRGEGEDEGGLLGVEAAELDGEHDSDEKTHRAGRSSGSGESRRNSRGEKVKQKAKRREKGSERKDGEHGSRTKKKAAAAKGRVAAWLGSVDPEVPPMEELVPPSPTVSRVRPPFMSGENASSRAIEKPTEPLVGDLETKPAPEERQDVSAAPNPRSSGFVPIGTFRQGTSPRHVKTLAKDATVVLEAKRITDLWSSASPSDKSSPAVKDNSPVTPLISAAPRIPQSIMTDRRVSPPSSAAALDVLGAKHYNINAGKAVPTNQGRAKPAPPKKITAQLSPRLPSFPPQVDTETKYDIRSARGGRGGKVTAITSIWASGTPEMKSKPTTEVPALSQARPLRTRITEPKPKDAPRAPAADPVPVAMRPPPRTTAKSLLTASAPPAVTHQSPEPKLVDLAARRPRPMVKASSVPAVISSSHATPTLSSTASLARPPPSKARTTLAKIPPTIVEARPAAVGRVSTQGPKAPTPAANHKPATVTAGVEMAFGQARLRDLIKKYQGQG